ncbi:hypothetical protein ACIBCR_15430 [Micromonospora echinospora]
MNTPSPNRWPIVNANSRSVPALLNGQTVTLNRPYQPRTAAGRSA